jgi:hypothetical protein
MQLYTIPIDRLEHIHREREETELDPLYQQWIKELGVSSMWSDPALIYNAREAMRDWDISRFK